MYLVFTSKKQISSIYLLSKIQKKTHQMPQNCSKALRLWRLTSHHQPSNHRPSHIWCWGNGELNTHEKKNNCNIHVLHELKKTKLGFSLIISKYALKYSALDSSIYSQKYQKKKRTRCHQTVPRFQNFPGVGSMPPDPPSKALHLLRLPFHLWCSENGSLIWISFLLFGCLP